MFKKFYIFLLGILPTFIFYCLALYSDFQAKVILADSNISQALIQDYISETYRFELIHRVAIHTFNKKTLDCPTTLVVADKLISLNTRSPFAYYLKAACAEKNGNDLLTYEYIKKANSYQPIKLEYRTALVIAGLRVGKIGESKILLKELLSLYPEDSYLVKLEKYVTDKSEQQ